MCCDYDGGGPFSRQVALIWVNGVNRSWRPRVTKGQKVVPNAVKKNLIVKSFDVSFPPKLIGTT